MRRAGRKKKPLTIQPIKCVVMLSSDEEHDCIAAEKKEDKQLNESWNLLTITILSL
mgnify:CR=1 FL=1